METEKVDITMRAAGKGDVSHKEPKHVGSSALDQGHEVKRCMTARKMRCFVFSTGSGQERTEKRMRMLVSVRVHVMKVSPVISQAMDTGTRHTCAFISSRKKRHVLFLGIPS